MSIERIQEYIEIHDLDTGEDDPEEQEPACFQVVLHVGVQSFWVNAQTTAKEAVWMKDMLAKALNNIVAAAEEGAEKAEGQRDATIHELDLMNKNYAALESRLRGVQEVYDENVDDIAVNGIDEELKYTFWAAIKAASTPKKGEI